MTVRVYVGRGKIVLCVLNERRLLLGKSSVGFLGRLENEIGIFCDCGLESQYDFPSKNGLCRDLSTQRSLLFSEKDFSINDDVMLLFIRHALSPHEESIPSGKSMMF